MLGSWGGQHFYLGNVGKGILSVFFSWTFIPAIIGVVDGIKFLSMSEEEFNAKYNSVDYMIGLKKNLLNNHYQHSHNVGEELEKLANLMDRGLITFEEFEKRKKKILG
ncbi:MAG: hypothetical protein OHK0045_11100 [Raineya sp.]